MDADDARRAQALPIFGGSKLPDSAMVLEHNPNERGTLIRLLTRAWPFIDRYISARWLQVGITGKPREEGLSERSGGFIYAPILFTLIVFWGASSGVLDVSSTKPGAQAWASIGRLLVATLAGCAWAAWFLDRTPHARLQIAISIIGVVAGFLAWSCYGAIDAGGARWFTFALWAIYMAGWFIRFELQNGKLIMGVRVQSHVLYHFIGTWAMRTLIVVVAAVTTELMIRNILLGAPLSPALAGLTGKAELARGAVESLTGEQRVGLLWNYFMIAGGMYALNLCFSLTLLPFYAIWIQQKINQDLRLSLVERWHRLSMRYHADQRVGDSIYRIYQDSAQIVVVISRMINFVTWIYGALTALFLLCFFDPRLAGVASLIIIPGLVWATFFSPRMRVKSMIARQTNSNLTSRIQEILSGLRVIKAYGREKEEQRRFEADSVVAFNAAYSARSWVAVTTILTFTMTACVLLPGEYLMAVWANEGVRIAAADLMVMIGLAYTTWNLPAFSWVKDRFFETAVDMRLISREWAVLQDTAMGLHRVFEILDIEPDVSDAPDAKPMGPFSNSVDFEDVAFSYADDRQILSGVNFSAKAGTITAIVGPTGSGKSTMMMLMLRLFDPDRGRVLVDGVDVRDIQVDSLRDNISIALQENILFAMSVKDNIRYVRPQTPDAEVARACKVACADDFINELPEGYDTVLGDRGGRLSTGQRQRLSIARALIKDAPVLILDEPTAALDAATEHRVMHNLHEWGKDRAIFIITHRLSTIRQADTILFLHDGQICESGSHEELMNIPTSRYRQMVRTESGQAELAQ